MTSPTAQLRAVVAAADKAMCAWFRSKGTRAIDDPQAFVELGIALAALPPMDGMVVVPRIMVEHAMVCDYPDELDFRCADCNKLRNILADGDA